MASSSKPRSKLLLYAQSAQIVRDFLISKDSFRNLIYAPIIEDKKAAFALVIQTLKYRNVLIYLLCLAQIPGCRQFELLKYKLLLDDMNKELDKLGINGVNEKDDDKKFTTRTDQATVYYENLLFQTKKFRLLWSQDQAKRQENGRSNGNKDNSGDSDSSSDNDSDSDTESDSDDEKKDEEMGHRIVPKSSADEEGDTTGISNSWFSAYITYNHQIKITPNKPAPATTPAAPINPSKKVATTAPTSPNVITYRYPIECLLVLAYDVLFGSKELPKQADLYMPKENMNKTSSNLTLKEAKKARRQAAADARLKTFQYGVIDVVKMFGLPNPPKCFNKAELELRTKLIKKGTSYQDIENATDEIDQLAVNSNKKDKKEKKDKKDAKNNKSNKNDLKLNVSFPIQPTHYLDSIPILPESGQYSIGPGVTYKQRLAVALSYLTTHLPLKPDSTEQQVQQQQHPDLFIPIELRGHYKRTIPRYVRINTNKVKHLDIIDLLINEYGYLQLDVVPQIFQFPYPNQRDDLTQNNRVGAKSTHEDGGDVRDQFDVKTPGYLDINHVITQVSPNLRRNCDVWVKYENIINNFLQIRNPKLFLKFSKQISVYKQSTAAERLQLQQLQQPIVYNSDENPRPQRKITPKVFWVDSVLPDVLCFPPRDDTIVHCDLVKDGSLIIQDRSSCFPPVILNPPLGSVCIDACSAPGNKTSYLSALLKNTGKVYAIELNQTRANLMRNRMELTNSTNVEVVRTSFFDISPQDPKYNKVEYIMLDPSCSGSGNIHTPQFLDTLLSTSTMISPFSQVKINNALNKQIVEENKANNTEMTIDPVEATTPTQRFQPNLHLIEPPTEQRQHVESLSRLQVRLLNHAMSFPNLKAFIYSTCSIYRLENENVVLDILPIAKANGFELISALPLFPGRGVNVPINDDGEKNVNDGKVKKQKKNQEKKEDKIATDDQVLLGADLNKTVRVDHELYHAGGFYVALFAKPGVYPSELLDKLLDETNQRFPGHFQ
jgi:16S rRNA C967 or C1407 C5-methylase (RsmB/RsmF family)